MDRLLCHVVAGVTSRTPTEIEEKMNDQYSASGGERNRRPFGVILVETRRYLREGRGRLFYRIVKR